MRTYNNPNREDWAELCLRPSSDNPQVWDSVRAIMEQVRLEGDKALIELTTKFDGVSLKELKVSKSELDISEKLTPTALQNAIKVAKFNIEKFHAAQQQETLEVETMPGVICMRKSMPIQKVGLYIPGGSAPLFSTLLMLGIPAKLAGCKEIILCTPPNKKGKIHPAILFTAKFLGITEIYKVGGSQAIAAMTFGTESVPKVFKIFGPGNQYVTAAKQMATQKGIAIDMPAGPSEVLVIADKTAQPSFVAADLLSQAEHGADSQVILLTDNENMAQVIHAEVLRQVEDLPRKEIAKGALENSRSLIFDDLNTAMEFSNQYAPEHLIIASDNPEILAEQVTDAGSVFLGNFSCESAGDYASGTNHTLPTAGYAQNYSGVSLDSFLKKITFQKLSAQGIQNLGPTIEIMAENEGLQAHKNAVTLRLDFLRNNPK